MLNRAERVPLDGAFEAMYRRELHVLTALATSLTGSAEVGAELAQESMLRAYRSWPTVGVLDRPGAWTRRVLVNLAIDAHRRSTRERRAMERAHRDDAVTPQHDSSDRFWQAVRDLPDRQRAAVALHYIDDMSVADIAQVMQVATGTVKTSLFMARRRLAATLGAQEMDE